MSYPTPVLVHTPVHSQVGGPLTYLSEHPLTPGTLVRVPLGKRELMGVVWDHPAPESTPPTDPAKLRAIAGTLDGIDPLGASWRQLVTFAASYYQRAAGEVALAALPPQLRDLNTLQLGRRLKRHAKAAGVGPDADGADDALHSIALTPEQTSAIARIEY